MLKKMNQKIATAAFGLCLSFLFFTSAAWANALLRMEILSSPNPVGSGARALGMGGAFIAIADDATAASWNPGGLIQLEKPEMSAVFGYVHRREENFFRDHPQASGIGTIDDYHLNYLSVAYPFEINAPDKNSCQVSGQGPRRNMILSLNYQRMYDFNRHWNYDWLNPEPHLDGPRQCDYVQKGDLYALGLAYCAQITTDFSLGITLNDWGAFLIENKWEKKYNCAIKKVLLGDFRFTSITDQREEFSFQGWNATLGFLWRLDEHWSLGGVLKAPFTAYIEHTVSVTVTEEGTDYAPEYEKYDEELNMPMSYGIGLAYRFSDSLTLSADIYRTHWNDFELRKSDGTRVSPVSGKNIDDSDIDPTTWFRLGTEYLIIREQTLIPLRAGIFYDPGPAEESPDDYYGFSLGTGFVYKRFVFDVAYQFRFGDDVGGSMLYDVDFSQDISEHTVYSSLIIHF